MRWVERDVVVGLLRSRRDGSTERDVEAARRGAEAEGDLEAGLRGTACGEAELVYDETITPGGCQIETQHGAIDARMETQLERIASELL